MNRVFWTFIPLILAPVASGNELDELVAELTAGKDSQQARAIAIHDYVRDSVPFGFSGAFYDESAAEVLVSGVGFCNTKSTLFAELLNRSGIEARLHFVDISAEILDGFIDPGTRYVDHSYVEVKIEDRWLRVDSFIVDQQLADIARKRLRDEGKVLGYGVHVAGVSDWDAESDAFSQFVDNGQYPSLTLRDHGVFDSVQTFYESAETHSKMNVLVRLMFPIFARQANQRIQAMRML